MLILPDYQSFTAWDSHDVLLPESESRFIKMEGEEQVMKTE